jgi:energy-coupling factor transporter ATP-binding protein EcfA2
LRLSHIKLAGFKSFVDPTHIPVPGQLVGVVGPNGCGKSNVIDAVRWVLGESSAKHLRGETMQDVIFNGAGERKPSNRASVELLFDNWGKRPAPGQVCGDLGQAHAGAGWWSAYFINNLHVRKGRRHLPRHRFGWTRLPSLVGMIAHCGARPRNFARCSRKPRDLQSIATSARNRGYPGGHRTSRV